MACKIRLKVDIIERINLPYCSPLILCIKQNWNPADLRRISRLAIEYRNLNKETIFHNYRMSMIEYIYMEGKAIRPCQPRRNIRVLSDTH